MSILTRLASTKKDLPNLEKSFMVRVLHNYSKHCAVGISPLELAAKCASSTRKSTGSRAPSKMAKQLRESEIDTVVARYHEVRNIRQVAREFKLSRTTVAKHLLDRGVDTSRGMKPAEITRAVDLYATGLSSITIGKQLGYDNHTILAALRNEGVQIRKPLGG